jgi:hypothetical protein
MTKGLNLFPKQNLAIIKSNWRQNVPIETKNNKNVAQFNYACKVSSQLLLKLKPQEKTI